MNQQRVASNGSTLFCMEQATQQNAALVEESTAAADSLQHQAQTFGRGGVTPDSGR